MGTFEFFVTTPEYKRITTFQTNNVSVFNGLLHHQPVDFILRISFYTSSFSYENLFRGWRQIKDDFVDQCIVENHIGLLKGFLAFNRKQIRISWTCTY